MATINQIEVSDFVFRAYEFAKKAHEGQVRKYTNEPYINHPVEVMSIIASVSHTDEMLAAALLHDTVEDCDVDIYQIEWGFGFDVRCLVEDLTDVSKPSDGNRAQRKAIDRKHTANASRESKTIKLADLISNSQSICKYDKKFARVYMQEKELLLEVLKGGDKTLWDIANQIVQNNKKELGL